MQLYLHIPFCDSKCHYCAFTSLLNHNAKKPYMQALLQDIQFHFSKLNIAKKSIKTLFIGGGTPSVVEAELYAELFEFLADFFEEGAEKTSEANPHSSNKAWLKQMKDFGLNRISFGVQSFDTKKLAFLGRNHNTKDVYQSLENARSLGLENINIDLIYDSILDTQKMLDFELFHISKLKPKHLSAYHLTLEKNTPFFKKKHYKKNAPRLMKYFIKGIENLGLKSYEVSNFGQKCKHNLAYWQGKEYLGCGLSAVSFYQNQRFYTHKNLQSYIKEPCFRQSETLSQKELDLEHLFLGLRSCVGVALQKLNPRQLERAKFLIKQKKLKLKNERIYNTNFMLSDELVLFLGD